MHFLGCQPPRKSQLPWWSIAAKKNYSFLGGQGQPKKQLYLGGLDNFLGGCWQSRKLLFLEVVSPQKKLLSLAVVIFPWLFGKLSLIVVFLAASLQENHP
jgi:hypothetical protein